MLHTRPDVPSSGMVPSGQVRQDRSLLHHGPMRHPCLSTNPYRPTVAARPLLSPRPFFFPLSKATPRALAAVRKCARTALRPQRMPAPSPGPAQKKRNFLDLWQTIAQDLSRLFAVPGGCPSCPVSRKDWPEPLFCFRRPVPAPSLLPAAFRKALCAVWPEHDAHVDTDRTTRQGRTPFHRAALPQHRGTGAGWLPEALRYSPMDLNKKFWQG